MKNLFNKNVIVISGSVFFVLLLSVVLYAFSSGATGYTKKTTTAGCTCHNAAFTADVIVSITGPDTVTVNQTKQYSLTVSKASKTGAGLDIAAKNGTLSAVSSNIHLSNGELTHNNNIPMTSGSVTVQFNYTAPSISGTDSLFATGLATNSNGSTGGDDWNWAPGKRIIVKSSSGIRNISKEVPVSYSLKQNYPNPFNPVTNIRFEIPKSSFIKLTIRDITGKTIENLLNQTLAAGIYNYDWDASNYASGIYFYSLEGKDFSQTMKMMLVK
jgi:hypothetical protein